MGGVIAAKKPVRVQRRGRRKKHKKHIRQDSTFSMENMTVGWRR
jgi:hypothetical protein